MLLPGVSETSEATQRLIDEEVHRIVDSAHKDVLTLLRNRRSQLDDLVTALLKAETLDEADAYAAAGLTRTSASGQTVLQLPAGNGGGPVGFPPGQPVAPDAPEPPNTPDAPDAPPEASVPKL